MRPRWRRAWGCVTLAVVIEDPSRFVLPQEHTLADRYTVLAPISHGAMGAVYRARDTSTGAAVAVKHVTNTRHAERFEVEAQPALAA